MKYATDGADEWISEASEQAVPRPRRKSYLSLLGNAREGGASDIFRNATNGSGEEVNVGVS